MPLVRHELRAARLHGNAMSANSAIEWTDATWNPVTGCTKVSQGCKNCYAERLAPKVFAGQMMRDHHVEISPPLPPRPRRFTDVLCHPERLEAPLRWRKPRRIVVNSMSDLFHEEVWDGFIDKVFAVIALTPQHTYQILTKRPARMLTWATRWRGTECVVDPKDLFFDVAVDMLYRNMTYRPWPLPNVWLGVSVEDQASADERIPLLLQTPAAVRWISAEPLLGPVDLSRLDTPVTGAGSSQPAAPPTWRHVDALSGWDGHLDWKGRGAGVSGPKLDWVVAGGESGPRARAPHPDWFRSLRDQCAAVGVPFFFKQHGAWRERAVADPIRLMDPLVNGIFMTRVGKRAAGRLLDGRTHDEYPA